ncbi:MAG: GGDEF domain-containing protein [Deltaproteobacteria bacterium]|nr:GGDEF domain-containing protein [Deltaproteobacteria bacterium]
MIVLILAAIILLLGGVYLFVNRLTQRVAEAQKKLVELTTVDDLTQLYNRRYFFERLHQEVERAKRYQRPLSCVILDIDNFKKVNDTLGHLSGDQVLRDISSIIKSTCRQCDLAGRYGGEELIILLPETELEGAMTIAERIRQRVEQHQTVDGKGETIAVTVSLGVASLAPQEIEDLDKDERLIQYADDALLLAKKEGRNRVKLYHPHQG